MFECFSLTDFTWVELLEFMLIPHYSNQHRDDTPPKSFEIKTIKCGDENEQFLVVWDGQRPTDQQIINQFIMRK
jgi:hypothetical protein